MIYQILETKKLRNVTVELEYLTISLHDARNSDCNSLIWVQWIKISRVSECWQMMMDIATMSIIGFHRYILISGWWSMSSIVIWDVDWRIIVQTRKEFHRWVFVSDSKMNFLRSVFFPCVKNNSGMECVEGSM